LVAGRDIANQGAIEATLIGLFADLTSPDFVLTEAGEAARSQFIENLIVALDIANGKVTIDMETPLVTQLREFLATMRITFSTEG